MFYIRSTCPRGNINTKAREQPHSQFNDNCPQKRRSLKAHTPSRAPTAQEYVERHAMTSIRIIPVPAFLVFGPVSKSLVLLSNDLDMALVEAKHLWRFGLAHPKDTLAR
jgi:hypothetical protein